MVQAYVGQKLLKRDILRVFTMSDLYIFKVIIGYWHVIVNECLKDNMTVKPPQQSISLN